MNLVGKLLKIPSRQYIASYLYNKYEKAKGETIELQRNDPLFYYIKAIVSKKVNRKRNDKRINRYKFVN